MPMSNEPTLPEEDHRTKPQEPAAAAALVLLWSIDEPGRIGDVAILPPGEPGPFRILGRGEPSDDDPHERAPLARHRPGRVMPAPPLASPRVSRVQLRLRARGGSLVEVENLGRCKLRQNGREGARFELRPGDTLEIGNQLVFLCATRPAWMPAIKVSGEFSFGAADAAGVVGESPAAWELRRRIAFIGPRSGHVLIRGESGTGKELVARAIHASSDRAGRPLVARNAATLPEGIIDAELFGNVRNYPNPGTPERPGLVGEADGSTLFLDEFAELPPALQAHLLRVLDAGEYQRLGEARARRSDFRLVAATNRPDSAIKHDLFARLVFRIEVPSLNDRREDIPLLAIHLLRRMAAGDNALTDRIFPGGGSVPRLSTALVGALARHRYTTHVRELEALLWQSLTESSGPELEIPRHMNAVAPVDEPPATESWVPPQTAEPRPEDNEGAPGLNPGEIQACLDRYNGVLEEAWKALGLSSRHALARLVKKHGLIIRKKPR
jgi:two-component system nitrogen regulation response regulator GlnG/two-component system response regulator HydG